MAIQAGDVVYSITGDMGQLDKALGRAEVSLRKASTFALGFGTAVTGAAVGAVKVWADAGDQIQKFSLRTGIATETASELKYAVEQNGGSVGDLGKAFTAMTRRLNNFERGGGAAAAALEEMGYKADDFHGLNSEQRFLKLVDAISQVEDHTKQAALAQDIFSQGAATQLLPFIQGGTQGFRELAAEAQSLGLVFSQESADAAAQFNDSLARLQAGVQGVAYQVGPLAAEVAESYLPAIENALKSGVEWLENNQELVQWLIPLVAKVGGLSLALGTAGKVMGPFVGLTRGAVTAMQGLQGVTAAKTIGDVSIAARAGSIGAGPVGLSAALLIAVPLVYKAVDAFIDMRAAQEAAEAAERQADQSSNRMLATLEAKGVRVSDLNGTTMKHNELMAALKDRVTEAEQAQGREISALNGVSSATQEATRSTDGFNTKTASALQILWRYTEVTERAAEATRELAAAQSGGGMSGGMVTGARAPIPGLATGGVVGRSGAAIVGERGPELLTLPRAAVVQPLPSSAAGASSGPQTVNVNLGGMEMHFQGLDPSQMDPRDWHKITTAIYKEFGEKIARGLRGQGSWVPV